MLNCLLMKPWLNSQRLRQSIRTKSWAQGNFISHSLRATSKPGIIFAMRSLMKLLSGVFHPPEVVVGLMRNFLQTLPLPIGLYMSLILCGPKWYLSARLARPSTYPSQVVNWLEISGLLLPAAQTLLIQIGRLFGSHAGLAHVTTLRQNVTMGLKKRNTVFLYVQSNGRQFRAVLMMVDSPKADGVCLAPCRSCCCLLQQCAAVGLPASVRHYR